MVAYELQKYTITKNKMQHSENDLHQLKSSLQVIDKNYHHLDEISLIKVFYQAPGHVCNLTIINHHHNSSLGADHVMFRRAKATSRNPTAYKTIYKLILNKQLKTCLQI